MYERTYGMGWVAMAIGIWVIIASWAGLVTTGMAARGPHRRMTPAG
ncbi:hypothetical protein ACIRVK_16415 [Streptomyces sp. NPDC101152]